MICLHPECPNTTRTRGLCHNHYQAVRDRVRKGQAEEADLVRRGLMTEKGTGGTASVGSIDIFLLGSEVRGTAG